MLRVFVLILIVYISSAYVCPNRNHILIEHQIFYKLPNITNMEFISEDEFYVSKVNIIYRYNRTNLVWDIKLSYIIKKIKYYDKKIYIIGNVNNVGFVYIINKNGKIIFNNMLFININNIYIHKDHFYLTGYKYIDLDQYIYNQSYISQHSIRKGMIWEKLLYNNSYGLDIIVNDTIYVTGIVDKNTFLIKMNFTDIIWSHIFEPYHCSKPIGIKMNNDMISISGWFNFHIKIDNVILKTCGFGNDSYLITIDKYSGKILFYGVFCGSHIEVKSFYIDNCFYYVSGTIKIIDLNFAFIGTNLLTNVSNGKYYFDIFYTRSLIDPIIKIIDDYIYILLKQTKNHISRFKII